MKNRYILIFLALIFITACDTESFFELERPPQSPWQSVTEYEMAAASAYNYAFYDSWSNFYVKDVVNDFITSDLCLWSGNKEGYDESPFYNRNFSQVAPPQDGSFSDCYKIIGICNAGLDFYNNAGGKPLTSITTSDQLNNVDRIAGELYFMRAFAYYYNVRRHCPPYDSNGANADSILPLRLSLPTTAAEASRPVYATTKYLYDSVIVKDLKKAKSLLPENYSAGAMHPSFQYGRANRFVAAGFLARVYFVMGNYKDALAELDYIINSKKYSLESEPLAAFIRNSHSSTSPEVMWYIDYTDPLKDNNFGPKQFTLINKSHYTSRNGGRGADWSLCPWNMFSLSKSALQSAGWMQDPMNGNYTETAAAKADKRYQQLYYRIEGLSKDPNADPTKYITDQRMNKITRPVIFVDKYYRSAIGMKSLVPIMRITEMYLTRSILLFKKGDLAGAAADLNIVRQRAWDSKVGGAYIPVTVATITEEMIHSERIKELAGEEFRLDYLFALRLPLDPGDREETYANRTIDAPYAIAFWKIPQAEQDFKKQ